MVGHFFDYEEIRGRLYALRDGYSFTSLRVWGRSLLGRALFGLQIGEGENGVLLAGGFRGQEGATTLLLMAFAERFCEVLEEQGELEGLPLSLAMKGKRVVVLPCVNPDGLEIAQNDGRVCGFLMELAENISEGDYTQWNANARGVDISRNFPAKEGQLRQKGAAEDVHAPAPQGFGGIKTESEPETRAVTRLCRSMDFRHAVEVCGRAAEPALQYREDAPPEGIAAANALALLGSGEPAKEEADLSDGTFQQWFTQELHRPAFTLEMGGSNPSLLSEEMCRKTLRMLTAAVLL